MFFASRDTSKASDTLLRMIRDWDCTIMDMDFFEAMGYRHYRGSPWEDDRMLPRLNIYHQGECLKRSRPEWARIV